MNCLVDPILNNSFKLELLFYKIIDVRDLVEIIIKIYEKDIDFNRILISGDYFDIKV